MTLLLVLQGKRIVAFVIGGMTRSEMRVAHKLSSKLGREVLLGSTSCDTPTTFLKSLQVTVLHVMACIFSPKQCSTLAMQLVLTLCQHLSSYSMTAGVRCQAPAIYLVHTQHWLVTWHKKTWTGCAQPSSMCVAYSIAVIGNHKSADHTGISAAKFPMLQDLGSLEQVALEMEPGGLSPNSGYGSGGGFGSENLTTIV